MAIMGKVWSIGKRRYGKDSERRMWLFDRLVWTDGLWSGNMGMEGKGRDGKIRRKVYEMDAGVR